MQEDDATVDTAEQPVYRSKIPFKYKRKGRYIDPNRFVGVKFGRWTVTGPEFKAKGFWTAPCRCECGKEFNIHSRSLIVGSSTQCVPCSRGCVEVKIGDEFGSWTVIGEPEKSTRKTRGRVVRCRCKCGSESKLQMHRLTAGLSKQCRSCQESSCRKGVTDWYWNKIVAGAILRGIPVSMSWDEAFSLFKDQGEKCALTGIPIAVPNTSVRRYRNSFSASADRIDNEKGYVAGNVQWVHKTINIMKHTMSQSDFVRWCELVANHKHKGLINNLNGESDMAKKKEDRELNPNAQALGKLGGVKGGPARAKALKPARRTEIASKAACARWHGGKDCPSKKGGK